MFEANASWIAKRLWVIFPSTVRSLAVYAGSG
jgi:hypothetical protein